MTIREEFERLCLSKLNFGFLERHPDGWYREDRVEYAWKEKVTQPKTTGMTGVTMNRNGVDNRH